MRAGRSLDALLAAYRVGARLAWRRFVEAGVAGGLAPADLYALGEAIFAYIDELSAESVEGYADEQSAAAGERQRLRRRLVRLVAQEPPPDEEALRAAAAAAGWTLPRRLAALVTSGPTDDEAELDAVAARLARRIGEGRSARASADWPACSCPTPTRPGAAASSRRPARAAPSRSAPPWAWRAPPAPCAAPPPPTRCSARGGSETPASPPPRITCRRSCCRRTRRWRPSSPSDSWLPLADLADGPRARLTGTLRAWLDRPGQVQAVAAELGVHPQTVRYRMRQLRELFGDRLEDPESRFELALALRAA